MYREYVGVVSTQLVDSIHSSAIDLFFHLCPSVCRALLPEILRNDKSISRVCMCVLLVNKYMIIDHDAHCCYDGWESR